MAKERTPISLDKLSPEVRAQLDGAPKSRGRKPGSKNRPKSTRYHGFDLGKPRGHRVRFTYQGEPGLRVFLASDFNGWNPEAKQLLDAANDGNYTVRCLVLPGRHEYKFVVNGEWILDPANQNRSCNERGDWNNVIVVE